MLRVATVPSPRFDCRIADRRHDLSASIAPGVSSASGTAPLRSVQPKPPGSAPVKGCRFVCWQERSHSSTPKPRPVVAESTLLLRTGDPATERSAKFGVPFPREKPTSHAPFSATMVAALRRAAPPHPPPRRPGALIASVVFHVARFVSIGHEPSGRIESTRNFTPARTLGPRPRGPLAPRADTRLG